MKFIEMYWKNRKEGRSEIESLGLVASHIAINGSFLDLQILHDVFAKDLLKNMEVFE